MRSTPEVQASTQSPEHKARGANRSTKVAGKLKVLPEQPEIPHKLDSERAGPLKDQDSLGDSDEADIDDNDEDQRDVEVSYSLMFVDVKTYLLGRCITKFL
jgi:hypothetical protein